MKKYVDATPEAGKDFYLNFRGKGKVVMLNLLKFKSIADYSDFEMLRPNEDISGREAYDLYMKNTLPHLTKAGSRILYFGDAQNFLIGPESKQWDAVLLVEHASVEAFMEFAQNKDYIETTGHRTAALEDSRLLPSSERNIID